MTYEHDTFECCMKLSSSELVVERLIGWTGRWFLFGGFVSCTQCFAVQTPDDYQTPFTHLSGCIATCTGLYPWQELTEVFKDFGPSTPL